MRICAACKSDFEQSAKELELLKKISPHLEGVLLATIPESDLCANCREQVRMSWRNERHIFIRTCDSSGERLFSSYPPETAFPVVKNELWWTDAFDATIFGKPIDFQKSVFSQMAALQEQCPRLSNFNYPEDRLVNSAYTNCAGDLKDCYLLFASGRNERCYYGIYLTDCFNCVDCFFVTSSTNCYESRDLLTCHSVFYSANCRECSESYFLEDCRNCSNCFACVGLRNKSFYIFNRSYSSTEYYLELEKLGISNIQGLTHQCKNEIEQKFFELCSRMPKRATYGENNENGSGNYISNTKDCVNCFDTMRAQDCFNCTWFIDGKDCSDVYSWGEMELCYQISGGGQQMYASAFTAMSYACKNSYYLDLCVYCKDCFACVGLKHKQYCILNKQYSKDEYQKLLPQIIAHMSSLGEWGQYLPKSMSPFGYNYSVAVDYYPLDPARANDLGFNWSEYKLPEPSSLGALNPLDIKVIDDSISGKSFLCSVSGKPYRLTEAECAFYSNNRLPIPIEHPNVRYARRLSARGQRRLLSKACAKCGINLCSANQAEQVYCDSCYLQHTY